MQTVRFIVWALALAFAFMAAVVLLIWGGFKAVLGNVWGTKRLNRAKDVVAGPNERPGVG